MAMEPRQNTESKLLHALAVSRMVRTLSVDFTQWASENRLPATRDILNEQLLPIA